MPTLAAPTKQTRVLLAVLVVALLVLAWLNRWAQDDAFITFRYSRNLVNGLGPVWNRDYVVEGYTNFLWMLLVAGGLWAGLSAELTSYLCGLAAFAASLLFVFYIARRLLENDRWALIATALVGTNYSFLMYATGGLETQLEAALTLSILNFVLIAREKGVPPSYQFLLFSLQASLAVMTRPDSVVPCVVAAVFVALAYYRSIKADPTPGWQRRLMLDALLLVTPALVLVGSWLLWKLRFYGDILPNTFRVKVGNHGGIAILIRGAAYVGWLLLSYWWLPLGLAIVVFARKRLVGLPQRLVVLLTFIGVWFAYVTWVGGDIMEFRLLIPIVPMALIVIVAALSRLEARYAAAGVLLLVLGSVSHSFGFPHYVRPAGIGNIPDLRDSARLFRGVGERIGEDLHENPDVTVAMTPAGFIPYFSNARSIDMLGLSDPWVARHGYVRSCRVCLGHARLATFAYLNSARVNLVIGHPQNLTDKCVRRLDVARSMVWGEKLDYENIPEGARVLAIPIGVAEAPTLAVLYIHPNPAIDAAIAQGLWRVVPEC